MGTTNPPILCLSRAISTIKLVEQNTERPLVFFRFSVPFLLNGKEIKVGCTVFDFGRHFTTLFQLFQ